MVISPRIRDFQRHTKAQRQKSLDEMHLQLKKFIDKRLQAALVSLQVGITPRFLRPNNYSCSQSCPKSLPEYAIPTRQSMIS